MHRIVAAIMLFCWSFVICNFPAPDANFTMTMIYDWYRAFSLPLWSLLTVGLWHDIGREIWNKWLMWDGGKSTKSPKLMWSIFTLWMTVAFVMVVHMHIMLSVIPLLTVLPALGWILSDWLVMDWSSTPKLTTFQFTSIMIWSVCSYVVYFGLNVLWVLSRVWLSDVFGISMLIN